MLNVGLLMKLAKDGLDPDIIAEALESMGLQFEHAFVEPGQVPMLSVDLERRSAVEGATAVRIEIRSKGGGSMYGLIIQSPAPPIAGARDRAELPTRVPQAVQISA